MNVDTVQLIDELKEMNKRLNDSYKEMYKQATLYSHAERNYRIAQQQKILQLKAEGQAATLILELAKGDEHVAEMRFERDLAKGRYDTAKQAIQSMQTMASVYQSILRVQNEA